MTPDQVALQLQQLQVQHIQAWITGIAIFLGPIVGVLFTFRIQKRKESSDAKRRLFVTLMAHRKSNPPTIDLVNSLNVIDVVFHEHPKVVELWHQYYDLLCQTPVNWHLAEAKYLDLVSAMARELHYQSLSQTDIARFYTPISHGNIAELHFGIQVELLRVLKNTAQFPIVEKQPIEASQTGATAA